MGHQSARRGGQGHVYIHIIFSFKAQCLVDILTFILNRLLHRQRNIMSSAVRTAGIYAFHNAGALTTTWSAPSGCPTGQSIYTGIGNPNEEGILSKIFDSCPAEEWRPECWPNGEKVIEISESIKEEGQLPITFYAYINSPGFHCPDAWETVGVASFKDGSLDPSGVFASTSFRQLSYDSGDQETTVPTPTRNFVVNALTSVLAPTETAIVCCPRYDAKCFADRTYARG